MSTEIINGDIINGELINGRFYWVLNPSTGEPIIQDIYITKLTKDKFSRFTTYNDLPSEATTSSPAVPDGITQDLNSNARLQNAGLFGLTSSVATEEVKPNKNKNQNQNSNNVLDNNWLKLNNVLDFSVGDNVTSIDTSHITEFFIKYIYQGSERVYKFGIAPSAESYVGGPNQTPEVKAGLLTRSSMAIKTFTIAGGQPVYQVLGIEPTLFYVTGLFIGAEGNNGVSSSTTTLTSRVYDTKVKLHAIRSAEVFDEEVAKSGRPIELHLYSKNNGTDEEIKIKYRCLVQNARYFMRRSDRVYYALDLFLMNRLS